MRHLKQRLIAAAFGLLPLVALADTISPAGKNTWDLYVYGNGPAISAILTAIKLMIIPSSGSSSFQWLLLFLATAGFLSMAVKAGFDPAKNFLKMFAYLLVVWMVTYLTRGASSNVNVMDPVTNYSSIVEGVPALVAVPASIISQVGYFLTLQIEQNFQMPNNADSAGLNLSSGAEYNLFAKMIGDSTQYTIQDPDLKRSMAAYMSDCVVAAVARGQMPVSVLMSSPNLMQDLSAATNQAIMTRYYLTELQSETSAQISAGTFIGPTCGGASASTVGNTIGNSGFQTTSPGLGVLVTCQQAYTCLMADMPVMASALQQASASQWQSAGVTVPFDTAMSSAIALAGASGGANQQSGYASPEDFILQKAMVSSATGAFRSAATQVGNNEIMMATSLAQAEQSQKSSWVTATEIFKNMMGYVYTVLQAFIFAMVPIVVICLMIPGMGGAIFVNYVQILVWLTLWTPMLAIVNFLIEIFGSSSLGTSLGTDGLTLGNSALVSEQANNLQIVAEFMGTLVPLMTWGLVKGAMAFTEFISHGIGSSFATQAGAQAATGNMSMGNIGMDNTTMNKYNTARSIATGNPAVEAGLSAGHGVTKEESSGSADSVLGGLTNVKHDRSTMVAVDDGVNGAQSWNIGDAQAKQSTTSRVATDAQNLAQQTQSIIAEMRAWGQGGSDNVTLGKTDSASINHAIDNMANNQIAYQTQASGDISLKTPGKPGGGAGGNPSMPSGLSTLAGGVGAGADLSTSGSRNQAWTDLESLKKARDTALQHAHQNQLGSTWNAGNNTGHSTATTSGNGINFAKADSVVEGFSHTASAAKSATESLSTAIKSSDAYSASEYETAGAGRENLQNISPTALADAKAGVAGGLAAQVTRETTGAGTAGHAEAGLTNAQHKINKGTVTNDQAANDAGAGPKADPNNTAFYTTQLDIGVARNHLNDGVNLITKDIAGEQAAQDESMRAFGQMSVAENGSMRKFGGDSGPGGGVLPNYITNLFK
jgi:hypothetical protein